MIEKKLLTNLEKGFRTLTVPFRTLPDFILIGTMRSGTTSFYEYMLRHPQIKPALIKEINFFTKFYNRGTYWYRYLFPIKREFLAGEASINYIWYPHAPRRIKALIPKVKLMVLVRNPVDRAYSHYQKMVRNSREKLSFEEALDMEEKRLKGEMSKMEKDESYYSLKYHWYSYIAKGKYIDQIELWKKYFPAEQIMVINSDDLKKDVHTTMNSVFEFLGISKFEDPSFKNYHIQNYAEMDSKTREELTELFRPYNKRLEKHLGKKLNWD